MSKKNEIISDDNTKRAHRRRLPALISEINAKLRNGERYFMSGIDYPAGMFSFVLAKFRKAKGWEITSTDYGTIRVRLDGDPKI